jgi:hypothetical protein
MVQMVSRSRGAPEALVLSTKEHFSLLLKAISWVLEVTIVAYFCKKKEMESIIVEPIYESKKVIYLSAYVSLSGNIICNPWIPSFSFWHWVYDIVCDYFVYATSSNINIM